MPHAEHGHRRAGHKNGSVGEQSGHSHRSQKGTADHRRQDLCGHTGGIIIPGVFVPLLKILSSKNAETLPTITAIKNLNLPIFSKSFLCLFFY